MTDSLVARGKWWLPEAPEHKVPGTLEFSAEKGGRLTLLGALRSALDFGERTEKDGEVSISMTEEALDRAGTYLRIVGRADGAGYTLEDCYQLQSKNAFFAREYATEVIGTNRILKGALFEHEEPLEGDGLAFGTRYLAEWVMDSGIKEEHRWREDGAPLENEPRYRIEAHDLPDLETTTPSGLSVELRHNVGIRGNRIIERTLTHRRWWHVQSPSKVALDDLVDVASDLQDLVSIAAHHTAAFDGVRLAHPDIYHDLPDGRRVPELIDLYVRWNVRSDSEAKALQSHDFLFSFDQFGGIDGVGRWLRAAETHRGSLGRVMATRYSEAMYVSDRLLNCAASLEAFDRTRTKSKKSHFKTRMKRCASFAGEPFVRLVPDIQSWAEAIRDERNDVAHNLGLRSRTTNTETYYLGQTLYWLFVMCMLRECGSPPIVFEKLQTHKDYQWLRTRIRGAMER